MNASDGRPFRALIGATLAAALALLVVSGFAYEVRVMSARRSDYRPDADQWLGLTTTFSSTDVAQGRRLFGQSCAHCHADDASGDEGPDLRGIQISDRLIARTIRHGIKGEMPSFAKKHGQSDIHSLLAYLRSLPEAPPDAIGSAGSR